MGEYPSLKTKCKLTFSDVLRLTHNIDNQFMNFPSNTLMLPIPFGGLVPTAILAERFLLDPLSIIISGEDIPQGFSGTLLIVSDITESGGLLNSYKVFAKNKCNDQADIRTISLITRDTTEYVPDHYGMMVNHKVLITFPWEVFHQA